MRSLLGTALSVLLLLAGCGNSARNEVYTPETPPISARLTWAVVQSPYLALYRGPGDSHDVIAQLRRGSIVEIIGQTPYQESVGGHRGYWYEVLVNGDEGWLFGGGLQRYAARDQAVTASQRLRNE